MNVGQIYFAKEMNELVGGWAYFHQIPVQVFIDLGKNPYEYPGPHAGYAVATTVALDSDDIDRGAFAFKLEPVEVGGSP